MALPAPQQPTARGIRIRKANDTHLLFYAVVRDLFSHLDIPIPPTAPSLELYAHARARLAAQCANQSQTSHLLAPHLST